MAYDWSEIGLATVRDVTDSYILHLRYFLFNRWQTSDSSL